MVLFRRLRAWLRRSRLDAELREELAQHTAWKTESLMADGLDRRKPGAGRRSRSATPRVTASARAASGAFSPRQPGAGHPLRRRASSRSRRRSPASPSHRSRLGLAPAPPCSAWPIRCCFARWRVRDPASLVLMRWTSGPVFPFSLLERQRRAERLRLCRAPRSRTPPTSRFARTPPAHSTFIGFADLYRGQRRRSTAAPSLQQRTSSPTTTSTCSALLRVIGRALGAIDDRVKPLPRRLSAIASGSGVSAAGGRRRKTVSINAVPVTVVGIAPATLHGTGQVGTDPDLFVPLALHGRLDAGRPIP